MILSCSLVIWTYTQSCVYFSINLLTSNWHSFFAFILIFIVPNKLTADQQADVFHQFQSLTCYLGHFKLLILKGSWNAMVTMHFLVSDHSEWENGQMFTCTVQVSKYKDLYSGKTGQLGQWWDWTSKLKLLTKLSFGEGTISSSLWYIIFGILVAKDCRNVFDFKSHSSHIVICGLCNKVAYKTANDITLYSW